MRKTKQTKLEAANWRVGTTKQFLGLSNEGSEFVELKLMLAKAVRQVREREGMTQAQVAQQIGSSQSRVAKMEAGDASVSLDLLIRTLLVLGASRKDVARVIASSAA